MKDALEAALGRPVSRETFDLLDRYVELLREESEHQNLIARSTLDEVWTRHILDSAQLIRFAPRPDSLWLDIGSGAGLPGIVIAILSAAPITLVEPRRLRAAFLERCVTELGLSNATVQGAKIEAVSGKYDCITARAVAPLAKLFGMALHLSHPGTIWLLPKGRSAKSELDEARRTWQGEYRMEASQTDAEASIVIAAGVRRRPGAGGTK